MLIEWLTYGPYRQKRELSTFDFLLVDFESLSRVDSEDVVTGGYGSVWFATMATSDKPRSVAVKELRQSGKWQERSRKAIVSSPLPHTRKR